MMLPVWPEYVLILHCSVICPQVLAFPHDHACMPVLCFQSEGASDRNVHLPVYPLTYNDVVLDSSKGQVSTAS